MPVIRSNKLNSLKLELCSGFFHADPRTKPPKRATPERLQTAFNPGPECDVQNPVGQIGKGGSFVVVIRTVTELRRG